MSERGPVFHKPRRKAIAVLAIVASSLLGLLAGGSINYILEPNRAGFNLMQLFDAFGFLASLSVVEDAIIWVIVVGLLAAHAIWRLPAPARWSRDQPNSNWRVAKSALIVFGWSAIHHQFAGLGLRDRVFDLHVINGDPLAAHWGLSFLGVVALGAGIVMSAVDIEMRRRERAA